MSPSRRQFLMGSAAALLLAACGSDSDEDAAGENGSETGKRAGAWSFKDDLGTTIELDEAPERIAAYIGSAAVLWDFGVKVIGVFGPQRQADGTAAPATGRVDLGTVADAGEEEVDLEKLAAMRPDLIVLQKGPSGLDSYPITDEQLGETKRIAPFAAVTAYGAPAHEVVAAYERLAGVLGADLDAPQLEADKAALVASTAKLKEALAAKPGLVAMFTYADAEGLYVARTKDFPDMLEFQALGLGIVEAGGPEDYFEKLSWEQADHYPADVIFHDERPSSLQPEELAKTYPTWRSLPAVKAGQIGRWNAETVLSHRGFSAAITDLTATIEKARPDVVK